MPKNFFGVGIIGAGNIGTKRAQALLDLGRDKLLGVFDTNQKSAQALAGRFGGKVYASSRQLLADPKIDAVVIAAMPQVNLNLAIQALAAQKHVLVEKPLGSGLKDANKVFLAAKKHQKILKVGFNHRHHPAIWKAYEFYKAGRIGKILCIRAVYGHGARPGYDTEWRMQKKHSSGGELFDQGVHIIDLANWFVGGFTKVFCQVRNLYWHKSDLEDNAFCQLYSKTGSVVDFHVSLTQWRNRFSFEIYGSKGYLLINGLGKSYGAEILTFGSKVGLGQVPKEQKFDFIGEDISWKNEWEYFRGAVINKHPTIAGAGDNLQVNKILENLYKSAKSGKIIKL